jgi:broad specificity phosphatase PhoE
MLVRHAMPAHGPHLPAHEWTLRADGEVAATALAAHLPAAAYLVASDEPKAWLTLQPAGPVTRDPRFREVQRDDEPYGAGFRQLRRAYVAGTDHAGWEPRVRVVERFDAGIADHLSRAGERTLVVAAHGMALTLWLSARVGLDDPAQFWAALSLPDAHLVDLAAGAVTRVLPAQLAQPAE